MSTQDSYLPAMLQLAASMSQQSPVITRPATQPAVDRRKPQPPAPRDGSGAEGEVAGRFENLKRQIAAAGLGGKDSQAALPKVSRPLVQEFLPVAPNSLVEARLTDGEVEAIVLKYLLHQASATGREIADQVSLPFSVIEKLLFGMKSDQLIVHKGSAPLADYVYQLTSAGMEEARQYYKHSSYFGAAPVHLQDYITSVQAQSISKQHPTIDDLPAVFEDLLVNPAMQNQIGQAIHSGHGFFLYGAPGNGKTSIAERVSRAFGHCIWIPRAIGVDGEVVRLFDPCKHVEIPFDAIKDTVDLHRIDRRWVCIRRPTIVVGGELTMAQLEITVNEWTGVSEAPLQLKSNCGTLVIDDFGRQRVGVEEILNRWIVPLDRRYDFLNLPSGKTIQIPFDQLLVFSTNLEPKDLVDEAFLRRLPYKIEVHDPSEEEFRELFRIYAGRLGFACCSASIEYVIRKHYLTPGRPFRFCHPRDLLLHVRNYCQFNKLPVVMSQEGFDIAVRNYFAIMG